MHGPLVDPQPKVAAVMLAEWGFLAHADMPDGPGPAYLLVALRAVPTLRHYDPEVVEYWVSEEGRGVRRRLRHGSRYPVESAYSWGTLRIVDRLGVANEYVSFGGHLSADMVDGVAVAVFRSPAPLLREGGHSQGWDEGALDLGAFVGRLRAAVGSSRELERLAAACAPLSHYAAFVADFVARYRGSQTLREHDARLWQMLAAEERRLRRDHPLDWQAGTALLAATEVAAGRV